MSKACRHIHAHRHTTLPSGAMHTVTLAWEARPPGFIGTVRIRWIDEGRYWQVCYLPSKGGHA